MFAVYGMIPVADKLGFVADYRQDVRDTSREAALTLVETHGLLPVLARALCPRMDGLPTRVPDWTHSLGSTSELYFGQLGLHPPVFIDRAAGEIETVAARLGKLPDLLRAGFRLRISTGSRTIGLVSADGLAGLDDLNLLDVFGTGKPCFKRRQDINAVCSILGLAHENTYCYLLSQGETTSVFPAAERLRVPEVDGRSNNQGKAANSGVILLVTGTALGPPQFIGLCLCDWTEFDDELAKLIDDVSGVLADGLLEIWGSAVDDAWRAVPSPSDTSADVRQTVDRLWLGTWKFPNPSAWFHLTEPESMLESMSIQWAEEKVEGLKSFRIGLDSDFRYKYSDVLPTLASFPQEELREEPRQRFRAIVHSLVNPERPFPGFWSSVADNWNPIVPLWPVSPRFGRLRLGRSCVTTSEQEDN